MHSGTANEDKAYAQGMDKGRFFESGYLLAQLCSLSNNPEATLADAIELLENRTAVLRRRNGHE